MDYLDPKKQRQHRASVLLGYVFVSIMIALTSWLLYNQAGGFSLDKKGQVVQSGLLFVSSAPSGASIRLNKTLNSNQTDARLSVLSGSYTMQLSRDGYRSWQQSLNVYGGSVQRYDYPFLIPQTLTSTNLRAGYTGLPASASQSPDKRWLIVQPTVAPSFELFDMKADKPVATTLTLPADIASSGVNQTWKAVQWANDNRHLLLQHDVDGKTEFITLDRSLPDSSINVSKLIDSAANKVTYQNNKFDRYYVYTSANQTLATASVASPQPVTLLEHVLEYKTYGTDMVLYASSQTVTTGKVGITVLQDGKQYLIREVPANATGYLLDFTQYSGTWYMALGANSDNRVYIYKDPVGQIRSKNSTAIASYVLKTPNPTFVGFSSNARYIVDESDAQFSVYDAENERAYSFNTGRPVDAPQPHAQWMDGYHLTYVSGGKLVLLDFDGSNLQTLQSASPNFQPFFASNYQTVASVAATSANTGANLQLTQLRTPADR